MCGDEHAVNSFWRNGFGMIRHSNVAFGSVEENVNVCSGPGLGSAGVDSIVGSSGGAITRHSCRAGSGSTLPWMSIARTWKTCTPGSISSIRYGDSHDSNGSASSAHSYSSTGPTAENWKIGLMFIDGFVGAVWIVVSGAGVGGSYVHDHSAGVGSAFSARSTARTRNL